MTLAAALKARWGCEQAHRQMKEELGLDHFEGRSWHRHPLMTMTACAFLRQPRLIVSRRNGKKRIDQGPPQPALPAVWRAVIKTLSPKQIDARCRHCRMRVRRQRK